MTNTENPRRPLAPKDKVFQHGAETEQKPLTPAEQLFERLEGKIESVAQIAEINNKAVQLFADGHLNAGQLVNFSVDFAKKADGYAETIMNRDMRQNAHPETKPMAYSAVISMAQESRNRVITIRLAQQNQTPSRPRNDSSPRS